MSACRRRRRRLTLAVNPELQGAGEEMPLSPTAMEKLLAMAEEAPSVSSSLEGFALVRRHSAPVLLLPTEARVRWTGEGSHFWALASGEGSEEESEDDGKGSPESGRDGKFVRDALFSGFSIDELKRAEALSLEVQSPVFGSANCRAG